MAGFGIGFGTGVLSGLSRNIDEEEQRRLLQAQLRGDILGLEAEAGETSSVLPTTTEPRSALTKLGGAFGLVKTPTERLEGLLERRGIVRGQAARRKEMQAIFKSLLDAAAKGEEIELTPELRKSLGPYALILDRQLQKVRQREAARRRLGLGLAGGVTEETEIPSSVETEEEDIPIGGGIERTTRALTRGETGALAIEAGYGDKIIDDLFKQPREDPTSLIQPGPGTPASIVNRRTGAVNRLPGTERPTDPLGALKRRDIESRITRREREPKLNQLQMVASELTARRQGKPPGSAVPEFAGLTNQELEAKVKSTDFRGLLAEILSQGETSSTPAPKRTQIPPGSKQIGTKNGKPVYQTPDGKRIVDE